jgi:hypothetical protein
MRKTDINLTMLSLILISCFTANGRQEELSLVSTSKVGVGYSVDVAEGYAYVTNNDGVVIVDVQHA